MNRRHGLVSVVIRTHNRSALLREAIASVIGQTYRPMEILVVDHDSTDDTRQVAESFGGIVRYIFHRGAFRDTFNVWRSQVRGEFVSVLDDDDYILPHCLARLVRALNNDPGADVAFGATRRFRVLEDRCEMLGWLPAVEEDRMKEILLAFNAVPWNAVMFRRGVLDRISPLPETLNGSLDWYFWMQVAVAGCRFRRVGETLGMIRFSADSVQFDITRMSGGDVDCTRYYGRHLAVREKLRFGYHYYLGYRLCRHGILLVESGRRRRGRITLLRGIGHYLLCLKGRRNMAAAGLVLYASLVSGTPKPRRAIERLLGRTFFRNIHEDFLHGRDPLATEFSQGDADG